MNETAIHHRPAELLQRLIRFDTSNPPGSERACIEWAQQLAEKWPTATSGDGALST